MVTITGEESGFVLSAEPGISSDLVSAPSFCLSTIHTIMRIPINVFPCRKLEALFFYHYKFF